MSAHAKMPTAARLVSTLGMMGTAWYATELMKPLLTSNLIFHGLLWINLVAAYVVGWIIIPRQLGWGIPTAIATGVTGFAVFSVISLFGQGFAEMIDQALQSRYNTLPKAITAVFDFIWQIGTSFLHIPSIATILGLCILTAVIAELLAKWTS